jgi:hypothetical protein
MRSIKIPRLILLLAAILGLLGWALALLVLTWHIDVLGPGTDWLAFYGAARAYLEGRLALIFDAAAFTAYLNADFAWWLAQPVAFRPWVYPPSFLLLLVPFGGLSLANGSPMRASSARAGSRSSPVTASRGSWPRPARCWWRRLRRLSSI